MNVGESPTSVPWERALTQRAVTDVSVEREEDTMLTGSSAQTSTNVKCEMVCAQEEPVRTWMEASNAYVEMDSQFLPAENDA